MKKDGHIHSPFCPHGSQDSFESYIEKAIAHQFEEITFTEHAPLPKNFIDPTPDKDSGMKLEHLLPYIEQLSVLKKKYENEIKINIGLEVDYIVGYEEETTNFLNTYGPYLDDAILSVHFLKINDEYTCIDYSDAVYFEFAKKIGSIKAMYDLYYETVLKSITADLGPYKPKRIGHPTLIHKFQLGHNEHIDDKKQIQHILKEMQLAQYELDVNSAGLSKLLCKEPYPAFEHIAYAKQIGVKLVFGSDAHVAKDLHQHYPLFSDF
jgi:histidinol-phosphatase (PHP family)